MAKILVIEDDVDLCHMIEQWLTMEHYCVELVHTGQEGLDMITHYGFDAAVVDWELPGISGLEVCKRYRSTGGSIPILFLTGKKEVTEKEEGLDSGADDYLTKPFHMKELSARIRALLRRSGTKVSKSLKVRNIELMPESFRVLKDGQDIELHAREFALLEFLMRHPEEVFSAEALLNRVWESSSDATPEALRTCMARLRKKIDTAGSDSLIKNVHGVGYKFHG